MYYYYIYDLRRDKLSMKEYVVLNIFNYYLVIIMYTIELLIFKINS